MFYLPTIPAGQASTLAAAADRHRQGMAPASHNERRSALVELRLGTVPRNESPDEARASFAKLIADLADVPADILAEACRAYVNEPGTRFFPRGAGELRTFTGPLMRRRAMRANRLQQMAEAALVQDAAPAEEPWTEADQAELDGYLRRIRSAA